ncbi:MAG TPA: histidine phosphatase family protein [Burkholderiales bacterium]|nr:histidine phosphatase family protein [Burkholderiales bacterium]
MTKIILTRHGRTEWDSHPPRFRGRADLALSKAGLEQARKTGARIGSSWTPSAVYSSPMKRCVITGQIIAAPFRVEVQPIDGLNDIDYGEWQGITVDEAKTRWPNEFFIWSRSPHLARFPRGESLEEVMTRASSAVRDVLRRHVNETIVLVGHNSVNRVILLHALGLSLSHYRCLAQDMCAISELNFSDGRFAIKTINESYHLNSV